jgi:rSAM/selenodomain-associated transferase 1
MQGAIVHIFAKAPLPGTVKTRLARTIGDVAACDLYRDMLAQTVRRLGAGTGWHTVLAVTPDVAADRPDLWPVAAERRPQGPGDLGARMLRVLATAREDRPVVIVGSDIPDLDAPHVASAFAALRGGEIVIGPALDGGFWLIGASAPPPAGLFDAVRWSTAFALSDTLANAAGLRVALLDDRLEDLDDAEGLSRLAGRIGAQP